MRSGPRLGLGAGYVIHPGHLLLEAPVQQRVQQLGARGRARAMLRVQNVPKLLRSRVTGAHS
jgi:hypothetical protein